MEEVDSIHSRDSAFSRMRHGLLTSPVSRRLFVHLFTVLSSFLSAFVLAIATIAFGITFALQCFSVFCTVGGLVECIHEALVSFGARIVSFFLMKRCFSAGSAGERERTAIGDAITRIVVGCSWSAFAYSLSASKLHKLYLSWSFFIIVVAHVWLQLFIIRAEEMFRRGLLNNCRESRRDRSILFGVIVPILCLLCGLIISELLKEPSLEALAMHRTVMCGLCQGLQIIVVRTFTEDNNNNFAHDDSTQRTKLYLEIFQQLVQVFLDSSFFIVASNDRKIFLFCLMVYDVIALSYPVHRIACTFLYERLLKRKYPRLSLDEFSLIEKDETCPVCLESHTPHETVRLPCGHLVHSSCVLSMARVAAANTRRYRTGHIYPLPTAAHKCPICRASLHFDIDHPEPSSGEGTQSNFATSSLIQPLSMMSSADSSLVPQQRTVVAQSALSATSIGAENIRSAIGARVLVALAARQRQPTVAVIRSSLRTIRGGGVESPAAVRLAPSAQSQNPPITLPITQTQRPLINSSSGQGSSRAASDTALGAIEASPQTSPPPHLEGRHLHANPSSNARRSVLRDAQLHAVLDNWFPPVIHESVEVEVEVRPNMISGNRAISLRPTNPSSLEAHSDQGGHAPRARSSSDLHEPEPLEGSSGRQHVFIRAQQQQGRKRKRAVVREADPRTDLATPARRSRRLLAEPPPKGGEGHTEVS